MNTRICGELQFDQGLKRDRGADVKGDHLSEARSRVMLMNDHQNIKHGDLNVL